MFDPAPAVVKAPEETPTPWSATPLTSRKYDIYLPADGMGPDISEGGGGSRQGSGRTCTRGQSRDWVGLLGVKAGPGSGLSRMSEQRRTRSLSLRKVRAE